MALLPQEQLQSLVTGNNASKIVEFDVTMASYSGHYFSIGTTNLNSAPLPLEFVSFDAKKANNNEVLLTWKTTSETNCKNFEVETSTDAQNWEKVGEVQAKNVSNAINDYSFTFNNQTNNRYFRIKQVDFDGKFEYSKTISLSIESKDVFAIFPNPTDGNLHITSTINFDKAQVRMMNMQGIIVSEELLEISNHQIVETTHLSAGEYLIEIIADNVVYKTKFIKK